MAFNSERYEIRFMVKDDVDEVARLFASAYGTREPVIIGLKMSVEELYENMALSWVEGCAEEDLSFVCVDKTQAKGNQIVGFRLTRTLDLKSIHGIDVDHNSNDKPELPLEVLMSELFEKWLESHPEIKPNGQEDDKHLKFLGLVVKEGYEGQQIATKLVDSSLKDAKSRGFKYGIVICSVTRSQHIFEKKFKFKRIASRSYKDIEFKGRKYLEHIVEPPEIVLYEIDFCSVQDCLQPFCYISKWFNCERRSKGRVMHLSINSVHLLLKNCLLNER